MKGVARLAVTELAEAHRYVPLADEALSCAVCGRQAEWREFPFSNSFSDHQQLVHSRKAACTACLAVGGGPRSDHDLRYSPTEGPGYVAAEGAVNLLSSGVKGLRELAALAGSPGPFGVLLGRWSANPSGPKHNHWLSVPVAHGAPRFPAYFTNGSKFEATPVVWLRQRELLSVADLAEGAIGAGESMEALRTSIRQRDSAHPELRALVHPQRDGRGVIASAEGLRAAAMRHVLFHVPPKQKTDKEAVK